MARFKTIAGYFKEVVTQQPIKVKQHAHVSDDAGNLRFEADGVKPIMEEREVEYLIDVKDRVWVDQVNIPFTPEEEAARDAEEELHEYEKLRPIPLTDRQEMNLLLESGPEAVKAKRAEHQKAMDEFLVGYTPLVEKIAEKHNEVVAAVERVKLDAVVEG